MGMVRRFIPLLIGVAVLGLVVWLSRIGERIAETPVGVMEPEHSPDGSWLVSREAVVEGEAERPCVLRLRNLRAEPVSVEIAEEADGRLRLKAGGLEPGDVLVVGPREVAEGQAVAPMAGLPEERLVGLVLEAGMAAVAAEDLPESVRYVSPGYRDGWGYNIALMRQLLKRVYKKFDEPRIELAEAPVIRVEGSRAVVQADVRVSALYGGRRNWLLGDDAAPNRLLLRLDKAAYGWKISRIEGLRPLGFDEKFLRLLGGEIGLPLSEAERREKEAACVLCRERLAERFGAAAQPVDTETPGP
jgi:hypothetical protein